MLLLNERRGVLRAQQNWRFIMYRQKFEMKKREKTYSYEFTSFDKTGAGNHWAK